MLPFEPITEPSALIPYPVRNNVSTEGMVASIGSGEKEFNYYTLGYSVRSQLILGSEDQRSGGGFSLAVGREDPKLRSGNVPGELIWETYFMNTTSEGVNGDPPNSSASFGVLASGRWRWSFRSDMNFFGDVGFGIQWLNQTSYDVPLAFNTTPSFAFGMEFKTKGGAVLAGARLLHVSNAGRGATNPGQNLLQWFIGFRY
jgi:hypothetical protein